MTNDFFAKLLNADVIFVPKIVVPGHCQKPSTSDVAAGKETKELYKSNKPWKSTGPEANKFPAFSTRPNAFL